MRYTTVIQDKNGNITEVQMNSAASYGDIIFYQGKRQTVLTQFTN